MFQVHYRKLHWVYKNSASTECLVFESAIFLGGFKRQNKVDQIVYIVLLLTGSMVMFVFNLQGGIQKCHCDFGVVSVFCFALDAVCLIL